jgi:prepilin-type N-terminal cleavage/methylation domain-containing protein
MSTKRDRGFSLLELLIVVAIILIIATIAIPNLVQIRKFTHESAAVSNLRTINTAEVTYLSSSPGTYGNIPDLITAGLLDSRFGGTISGYGFQIQASGSDYTATASPASTNSGRYGYYTTPEAVVRYQSQTSPTCVPCFPSGLQGSPVSQ